MFIVQRLTSVLRYELNAKDGFTLKHGYNHGELQNIRHLCHGITEATVGATVSA